MAGLFSPEDQLLCFDGLVAVFKSMRRRQKNTTKISARSTQPFLCSPNYVFWFTGYLIPMINNRRSHELIDYYINGYWFMAHGSRMAGGPGRGPRAAAGGGWGLVGGGAVDRKCEQ